MKKECAYTRKLMRKYLQGHVFKYQQIKITRHLNSCPVCRSEFQSLEHIDDTRQLLDDVNSGGGALQLLKGGAQAFGRLKVLFYRPLWLLVIAGTAVFIYIKVIVPGQRDIEIENIEKTVPAAVVSAVAPTPSPIPTATPSSAASQHTPASSQKGAPVSAPAPAAAVEPLIVVITPKDETTTGEVNALLRGYDQFKNKSFSGSVHQVSGALVQGEFLGLFRTIEGFGKVSYNRKKFASFPPSQPIPFVMKMKSPIRPTESSSSAPSPATDAVPSDRPTEPDSSQAAP